MGHPLAGAGLMQGVATSGTARAMVALLPGSRWKEVAANLPEMVRAAEMLGPGYAYVVPVASTIDRGRLEALLREIGSAARVTLVPDAREALEGARASVVASGTATVLAAVVGNPFVMVYRVSPMTFRVAKRLVRYPAEIVAERDADGVLPVAMVNLLAGRRVVPELINERFTAEGVVRELRPLLAEGTAREAQMDGLRAVRESLGPPGDGRARGTERVAEVVVELMERATGAGSRGKSGCEAGASNLVSADDTPQGLCAHAMCSVEMFGSPAVPCPGYGCLCGAATRSASDQQLRDHCGS